MLDVETPHGNIVIAVDTARAPMTAANFLKYVDGGFYDGGRFHRAARSGGWPRGWTSSRVSSSSRSKGRT